MPNSNNINNKCPLLIVASINSKISFTMHAPGSRHSTTHLVFSTFLHKHHSFPLNNASF